MIDQAASRIDYPGLARERAKRRRPAALAAPRVLARPYGQRRDERYAAIASAPSPVTALLRAPSPAIPSPEPPASAARHSTPQETDRFAPLPISLSDELARVREAQELQPAVNGRPAYPRRRPVRTAVLSAVAVLVLVAAAVIGPVVYRGINAYQDVFEEPVPHNESPFEVAVNPEGTAEIVQVTTAPEEGGDSAVDIPAWNGQERLTILLLGVDRREDEASRSDTMILINIDPVSKRAGMLSIPRDLKVIIPGYGVHKINAAYAFGDADEVPGGGPGLVIRTIEANFGITVNHYAQVDFEGFVKIIDTIGGLTIDVPYPIKDDAYPGAGNNYQRIYFQTGWQHMDGERVLQYARTRHDDGDGRRSARQQQVLLAMREQGVRLNLLSKASELLAELGDAVRTDLQPSQALQLARLAMEIDPGAIEQFSLDPALYEEQLPNQPYYLIADWSAVGAIVSEFTGESVFPPMAAIDPNYDIQILVEDGTLNPGLGGRIQQVLIDNGFWNVTVVDKPDLGNYPVSSITTDRANLGTAYLVAGVLGLDLSAISVVGGEGAGSSNVATGAEGDWIAESPSASAGAAPGNGLVVVIGDDARDPAYFTADPLDDPPAESAAPLDESIEGGGEQTDGSFDEPEQ